MAAANTVATFTGLFKERYAGKLERLIPEEYVLQNMIGFNRAKKLGNLFHQPVVLQREQGVTYAETGAGTFTIDAAIAGQLKDAQVQGSQVVIRGAIDYESLAKGDGKGEHSFEDSNSLLLENIMMTIKHRLEVAMWYGQDELGTVASVGGTTIITITTAEWASGIWSGQEGARLEAFDSAGTTQRTGVMTIASVDIGARTVTVDAVSTGLTATDRIFFKTERTTATEKNFAGMHKIMNNTGTLFNISASTYSLWKSNIFSAGSTQFSFETAQTAFAVGMGKGLKGDTVMLVSPRTWADLMNDQAALRRHGDPNKSARYEMGAEEITFYSQLGRTRIQSSIMCKEGYAYVIKPKLWQRIGATDITFDVPGRGGELYKQMESQAGIEIRAYYHQALFSKAPGRSVLVNNIVNS